MDVHHKKEILLLLVAHKKSDKDSDKFTRLQIMQVFDSIKHSVTELSGSSYNFAYNIAIVSIENWHLVQAHRIKNYM